MNAIPPEDCIPTGHLNRGQFKVKILARLTVSDTVKLSIEHNTRILVSLELDYPSTDLVEGASSSSDTH